MCHIDSSPQTKLVSNSLAFISVAQDGQVETPAMQKKSWISQASFSVVLQETSDAILILHRFGGVGILVSTMMYVVQWRNYGNHCWVFCVGVFLYAQFSLFIFFGLDAYHRNKRHL